MKKIAIIFSSAIAICSCAKVVPIVDNARQEIRFTASNCITKSNVEYVGDNFGAYGYADGQLLEEAFMDNAKIEKSGSVWAAVGQKYYWPKKTKMDFICYSPYSETGTAPVVTKDTLYYENIEILPDVDLSYSSKVVGYSGADEYVPALFHHALTRLIFNIRAEYLENIEGLRWEIDLDSVAVAGLYCDGSLKLAAEDFVGDYGLVSWELPESKVWNHGDDTYFIDFEHPSSLSTNFARLGTVYACPTLLEDGLQTVTVSIFTRAYLNDAVVMSGAQEFKLNLKAESCPAWLINQSITYNIVIRPTIAPDKDPIIFIVDVDDWVDNTPEISIEL